jgi:hypothetical protein
MNPRGQKEERKEVNQLPHMAVAKTAGARQRSAATPTATRSRQRARGLGLGLVAGERSGLSPTGPSWLDQTHSGWSQVVIFLNN